MPELTEIHGGQGQPTQQVPEEGFVTETHTLSLDISDDELTNRIDGHIREGRSLYDAVKQRADNIRPYWLGNQLDNKRLKAYQSKIVDNIVFRNMETMLPVITQNTPLPTFISSNKEMNKAFEDLLVYRWEVQDNMLSKNRRAVRSAFLDLLGVEKYRFDPDRGQNGEIVWEHVKTWNLIIDNTAIDSEDVSWVAEYITSDTLQDIIDKFPDAKSDLLESLEIESEEDPRMGSKLTYVEFWTPEFVCWKYKDIVLDKYKNPNWDWGSDSVDEKGNSKKSRYNLWDKPRVPYNFMHLFNIGGSGLYGDTSLIEQTITMQDGINKRKRQISDNADEANGTLVGSGDGISRDEFSKIDDQPKTKIWVDQGDPRKAITRIPGNPLQGYVFDDMVHSERAMDDIWGTHAITRGAASGEDTATQDVLQQRQDFGRIDDIVKAYEDFNEQYYQATFQMMLVHFSKEHTYSFEDDDDLVVSRETIINAFSQRKKRRVNEATGKMEVQTITGDFRPPVIMVKRGSTLPVDEVSKRAEALQLAGAQRMSTLDLLEALEYPNAREMARNVWLEFNQPEKLYPELVENAQEIPTEAAIEDFQRIVEGKETPPSFEVENPVTAEAHLKSHAEQFDSKEFEGLDEEKQRQLIAHAREESGIARTVLQLTNEQAVQEEQSNLVAQGGGANAV